METARPKFPGVFWNANLIELFERGAYYSMASFVVIYLGRLGLGDYLPSTLNGILWALVYFLPILSGTIADNIGYRRALVAAFLLLAAGYFMMGLPVWSGMASLKDAVPGGVNAGAGVLVPLSIGIVLIGIGGSIVKPCISGTVQKTSGAYATLGFAIFYMVVNIGSLFGRFFGFIFRTWLSLEYIFAVAMCCAAAALIVVIAGYRDPDRASPAPKRTASRILVDMVAVLKNPRFTLFLLVMTGFWFIYTQIYNVIPLYLKKTVELNPHMDLYTMANPLVIVCFQLVITKAFGRMRPVRSIIIGIVLIGLSMVINIVPVFMAGGTQGIMWGLIPAGAVFAILAVAAIAFGELFAAARNLEYIGSLAPKGQEGLFLGYSALPTAIGSLLGGPVGAAVFNEVMCRGASRATNGLLVLKPESATAGWLILAGIGLLSAVSMWLYNRWLERESANASV